MIDVCTYNITMGEIQGHNGEDPDTISLLGVLRMYQMHIRSSLFVLLIIGKGLVAANLTLQIPKSLTCVLLLIFYLSCSLT